MFTSVPIGNASNNNWFTVKPGNRFRKKSAGQMKNQNRNTGVVPGERIFIASMIATSNTGIKMPIANEARNSLIGLSAKQFWDFTLFCPSRRRCYTPAFPS